MPVPAPVISLRIRRLWLTEIIGCPAYADSDLTDVDLRLRRSGRTLVASGPRDFGIGNPFANPLGDLLRRRLSEVSGGAVSEVTWEHDDLRPLRRARTNDLDVLDPGDPTFDEYAAALIRLRSFIGPDVEARARAAVARASLAGLSRHRLWLTVADDEDASAFGSVPGARAALVTAIQRFQRHELPLYRILVDPTAHREEWGL